MDCQKRETQDYTVCQLHHGQSGNIGKDNGAHMMVACFHSPGASWHEADTTTHPLVRPLEMKGEGAGVGYTPLAHKSPGTRWLPLKTIGSMESVGPSIRMESCQRKVIVDRLDLQPMVTREHLKHDPGAASKLENFRPLRTRRVGKNRPEHSNTDKQEEEDVARSGGYHVYLSTPPCYCQALLDGGMRVGMRRSAVDDSSSREVGVAT